MAWSIFIGRHCSAKAIKLDLLIAVVELKNGAHAADDLQVLIALWVEVVQRVVLVGRTIRQSEIDCDRQVYLAPSKDVL